jgi:glycosyltransferase involved in cell wall biosynthesis
MDNVTIIIPVFDIDRNIKNLSSFIGDNIIAKCEKIIIHDLADQQDSSELRKVVELVSEIRVIDAWCDSPGYARNKGLELATKDWVVFWDADDSPVLSEFAVFMQELDMSEKTVGVASYQVTDFQGKVLSSRKLNCSEILEKNYELMINPGLWSWGFKKGLIGETRFKEHKLGEDQIFLAELNVFDKNIYKSERLIYIHRLGSGKQLTFSPKYTVELLATAQYALKLSKTVELKTRKYCKVLASVSLLVFVKREIFLRKQIHALFTLKNTRSLFVNLMTSASILAKVYFVKYRVKKLLDTKSLSMYLAGGLGNQLFQLSFALSYTNVEKLELINPCKEIQELIDFGLFEFSSNSVKKDQLILRFPGYLETKMNHYLLGMSSKGVGAKISLNAKIAQGILRFYYLLRTGRLPKVLSPSGVGYDSVVENCLLSRRNHAVGYFQSYAWAHKLRHGLKRTLNQVVNYNNAEVQLLTKLVESSDTAVIQFRLGDFLSKANVRLGVVNAEYLNDGLNYFRIDSFKQIVVFTDDDTEAQKRLLLDFQGSVIYVPSHISALTCMLLMSKANWLVISNSTFGWWGAYLSSEDTSQTIAPVPWFKALDEPVGLIPENWNRVRVTY